jgi:hypothetical protein
MSIVKKAKKTRRGRKPKVQEQSPMLDALGWLKNSRRDANWALKYVIEAETDFDERRKLLTTILSLDELVQVTKYHAYCE